MINLEKTPYVLYKTADRDYLVTDSGEGYRKKSKEEIERAWAGYEDGLKYEIAWAEVSHLYN